MRIVINGLFTMNDIIKWEVELPSFSNNSSQEILNIVNSVLSSDFEELDDWLIKQVDNNNLKGFKRNKVQKTKFIPKDVISILDLKFNNQVFLNEFSYTLKIPLNSKLCDFNQRNFKIFAPEPWFIDINKIKIKELKTQKNITIFFTISFKCDNKITNDELYPNVECDHDFKIYNGKIYSGIRRWCLIWECKKCGFICFCSCFKEAIEGCKQGKIITELKFQDNYGNEIIDKLTENVSINERSRKERGFILRDLNLDADNIPYYDNACEVCRGKTSSHRYCSKMYARSEFEIKYGAYVKKKFFEYKLLNDEINDEDLKRKANNATREELGFKKIGERFVTETELYRIVKSIFPNDNVIHHYRAKWLKRQEIDIFIPHLSLAIEYDGIQHFKPIKAWGGEKGLKKNIERDKIKEEKCKENNVTLIRFTYKEDDLLSENYVKSKLKKYKIDVQ